MTRGAAQSEALPEIGVELALAPGLEIWVKPGPLLDELRRDAAADLTALLHEVGITGRVAFNIAPLGPKAAHGDRWLELRVGGAVCRYSDVLLWQVWSIIVGPTAPLRTVEEVAVHVGAAASSDDDRERRRVTSFLRRTCVEIVKLQPSSLLDRAHAQTFGRKLAGNPPEPDWLWHVLSSALGLRLCIADARAVVGLVEKMLRDGQSREEAAEELIAVLRRDRAVEVRLTPHYLQALTIAADEQRVSEDAPEGPFASVRQTVAYQLGLAFPDFRFVPVRDAPEQSVAFRINDLMTTPWLGLAPDEVLVPESPQSVELSGITVRRYALNPNNLGDACVIGAEERWRAEQQGFKTIGPLEYIALALSGTLQRHGGCFVDLTTVREKLSEVRPEFPDLVAATDEQLTPATLTRVLRALIAEGMSIRNTRFILERLLDFAHLAADEQRFIVVDDRLVVPPWDAGRPRDPALDLAAFVRIGMKRYLAHKHTRERMSMRAYLLDRELEGRICREPGGPEAEDGEDERILETVQRQVARAVVVREGAVVLTTTYAREVLSRIIRIAVPWLPVLAYQELAEDLTIQPITRIGFAEHA
jgi:type III secretory pathway component EscV